MRAGVISQRLFGPLSPGLELARRAFQPTRRVLEFLGLVLDVAVDQSLSELIANGRGERRVGMRVCDLQLSYFRYRFHREVLQSRVRGRFHQEVLFENLDERRQSPTLRGRTLRLGRAPASRHGQ